MVNILVIDDDPKMREMLSEILISQGYYVTVCKNGEEAIDASFSELFNIALIDIQLPDMEGTELLSKLRKSEPPLVKIVITGNATLNNSIEAANRGVDAYIVKPFNPDKLLKLIKEKLEEQKQKVEFNDKKVGEYIASRHEWMNKASIKK
ncbi:MAG: response regulator [Candidatus Bathyarchaeia archaeon]|jgi:DNA-binding NtrC family response regulator